jgi:hypothetical protein
LESLDPVLLEMGFPKPRYVEGRTSIANLFRKRRCGIYVLHFANGEYYAGKSIDVVRRYGDHRKNHPDIQFISFKQVRQNHLDTEERATIHHLQKTSFRLRNIQFMEMPYVETDFDQVMTRKDQDRWLNDPDFHDLSGDRVIDPELRYRYHTRFERLLSLPHADEVIEVLREYVRTCVPAVRRSEVSFWMCSCLPGNGNILYSRINVGWQTAFDAYVDKHGTPTYRWYLTREKAHQIAKPRFLFFDRPTIRKSGLVQGGLHQALLVKRGAGDAFKLLNNQESRLMVRSFALGLMRKSACGWSQNHCLDLADRLVE